MNPRAKPPCKDEFRSSLRNKGKNYLQKVCSQHRNILKLFEIPHFNSFLCEVDCSQSPVSAKPLAVPTTTHTHEHFVMSPISLAPID